MIPGSFFCLVILVAACSAVPLERLDRIKRSEPEDQSSETACTADGSTYREGEIVPRGNCEICTCSEGQIKCNKKKCPENNGCRKVQRANECCPEYICDCFLNNKTFTNGQKIPEDDPCVTCYCKGGEPMCNAITCYKRSDCKPIKVEGQCCPKYDNCPEGNSAQPTIKDMQPWPLTKSEEVLTSPLPSGEENSNQYQSDQGQSDQEITVTVQEVPPTPHSSEPARSSFQITEIYEDYKVTSLVEDKTTITFKEPETENVSSVASEEPTTEGANYIISPEDILHLEDIMDQTLNGTTEPQMTPVTAEVPTDMTTYHTTSGTEETTVTGVTSTEILKGGVFPDFTSEADDEAFLNPEDIIHIESIEQTTPGHDVSESGEGHDSSVSGTFAEVVSVESRELSGTGSTEDLTPTSVPGAVLDPNELPYLSLGDHEEMEEKPAAVFHVNIINLNLQSECGNVPSSTEADLNSVKVSQYSLNLKEIEKRKLADILQSDQPHNQTFLIFNNTAEKNEWAQNVFQQIVSNLNKPLNVAYVDEIIVLNTSDAKTEGFGSTSEVSYQGPTELPTDVTTESTGSSSETLPDQTEIFSDVTTGESSSEVRSDQEATELTSGVTTDGSSSEVRSDHEATELTSDMTTEGAPNFTDISEHDTNAIYSSSPVEVTTFFSLSEEATTGSLSQETNELQTAGFSTDYSATEASV